MKQSFVLFTDDYEILQQLNTERVGNVMMAVYAYELGIDMPDLDMAESVAFAAIKKHLDVTDSQYNATIEARREAGRKSAEQRRTKLNKAELCSTNSTDTDTVTDTVIKEKDSKESKKKADAFTPPSKEEVQEYCKERKNNVDSETFVDFYSAKGWMVGKNKMKDWKAAVRTWEKERGSPSPTASQIKANTKAGIQREKDLDAWLNQKVQGGLR